MLHPREQSYVIQWRTMPTDSQSVAVPQGVGIRLAAYLIDVFAMSLPTAVAIAIGFGRNVPTTHDLIRHPPGWLYLTVGLVQLVYFTLLEGAFATTLGKKACGLRVVAVADWSKCGWLRAFVRNLLLPIDEYPVYLAGVIAILVTGRHQRIGDLAGGTTVVRFVPGPGASLATAQPSAAALIAADAAATPAAAHVPPALPVMPAGGGHGTEDEPPFLEAGWYRSQEGLQVGPLTWDALWDMAVAGSLATADLVWHESYAADWVPASAVPELRKAFVSRPPA
jgi:uncharacterized RDD family membrane protein YckC